jgi:hypothetical protein
MSTEPPENDNGDETERRRFASPPCALADVDPAYSGLMPIDELLALLNTLLEGERAGARGITETCLPLAAPADEEALREIAADEGRFCSMLYRHIVRLGGTPSNATGAFADKLALSETLIERLQLLNRGQAWVVRQLAPALPQINDPDLRADLTEMLRVHENNIARCDALLAARSG